MANKHKKERTRVVRLDGKPINIVKRRGHFMVCAKGCCCGRTERGHAAVPVDFYKAEYKRRKLRNVIQLSMNGCLGPCPLSNVALLFFDGRSIWFQSINTPGQISAIFDYVEQMLAADRYLPPPAELEEYVFDYYAWAAVEPVACVTPLATCGTALPSRPHPRTAQESRPTIFFLSHADTDILTVHRAVASLPADFPQVTAMSLGKITTPEHMTALLSGSLGQAQIIVARILGDGQSLPGLDLLAAHARRYSKHLLVLSGTGVPDAVFAGASTVAAPVLHEATAYMHMGGVANFAHCLRSLSDHLLMTGFAFDPPAEQPQHGLYHPDLPAGATLIDWRGLRDPAKPTVGVLFYRAHWMSGNLAFIDMLVRDIERQGANALPVFTASLRDTAPVPEDLQGAWPGLRYSEGPDRGRNHVQLPGLRSTSDPATTARHLTQAQASVPPPLTNGQSRISPPLTKGGPGGVRWPAVFSWLFHDNERLVDVVITTISFALGEINPSGPTPTGWSVDALAALNVPILQAICAGTARWQWEASSRGLNPLDTAMNVALPEFDGRIITVPISFKEPLQTDASDKQPMTVYKGDVERMARVVGLALRFAHLARKPNSAKRIAFILTNAPGKASRIGNAVGLDSPASLIKILDAMRAEGYDVADAPTDGDALIHALIDRCSYDDTLLTPTQLDQAAGHVSAQTYQRWFNELPESMRQRMTRQWGPPPGEAFVHDGQLALAGLEFGNVFVALQPPRGYGMDASAIYHQPDLPPTHHYFALYRWLRDVWQADALVHVGKHGTLEWLPGKGVGLSADCFPDAFLADMPLFYPFIINDPGEGAQAKRRSHAVIIDHLTPPMTSADAYGPLGQLMQLVDEYYQVEMLDPSKMPLVQKQIWDLIEEANLQADLAFLMKQNHDGHVHDWEATLTADGTPVSLAQMRGQDVAHMVQELDGYLCELAGAQIRDGLHILGQVPEGAQLVGLLQALTRIPNVGIPSLRQALADVFDLDLSALLADKGARLHDVPARLTRLADRPLVTNADVLETLDELGGHLLALLQRREFSASAIDAVIAECGIDSSFPGSAWERTAREALPLQTVLRFVTDQLVPALQQTTDEITNLLAGLNGEYVPAGPSGAPTRGLAHVLPTGRNFYSVDPRTLPSAAAWQVGQELAREVLERHFREAGAFPESVGISMWGTSAMRTHGDDVAQAMALLGVRPVWQTENRRQIGVEVISLAELGRPRVDVTIRISGFFRDAFPHLIAMLDAAVQAVIAADEPPEQNFVRKHYLADLAAALTADGADGSQAAERAAYRIFGSKPGSYGAGLLPLIDERNWHEDADLAETYVNWGGYAYTGQAQGVDARDSFRRRLAQVEVAVHNQDNHEHDIFDSDDYFQFHGGMIATIRALTGKKPRHYFGDTHDPARPVVRDLEQEVLRVFRARVVNPKWIESITRHGYKGGLELAATVDYLFGYDATANVVADWMYEQVAQSYVFDPELRAFFERSNPWARQAITERLLEAGERGLWQKPKEETLHSLRDAFLEGETLVESRGELIG